MRVTVLAVFLMTLFSPAPGRAAETSLSAALSELRADLKQVRLECETLSSLSRRQQAEVARLSGEAEKLNADLLASRISQEKASARVIELSAELKALRIELADSKTLSSKRAMEISALILDRDALKVTVERQRGLLRAIPWIAVVVLGAGVATGLAVK